ncbi:MAG: hypothetical protein ACR2MF_11115 [Chthoniobacterales bacterium]
MGRRCVSFLIAFAAVGLFAIPAPIAQGQSTQDLDRAQLLRNQARLSQDPYVDEDGVDDNGLAAASPNDPDLGEQVILKRKEHYDPFTVSLAAPFFYTSNVALVRKGEQSDFLVAPAASVTYAPRVSNTFYAEVTIQEQQFYYDRFSEFDFGTFDIRLGVAYYLPKVHNLILRAQYTYNQLTSKHTFDTFFSDHALFLSVEMPFHFGRAQQVSVGADTSISFAANPDQPQRNEANFYIGYVVNLTRSLSLDLAGRIFLRDYEIGDRRDVSGVLALGANYRISKWFNASFISTYAASRSNHSVFDYDVANLGGAVVFSVKF